MPVQCQSLKCESQTVLGIRCTYLTGTGAGRWFQCRITDDHIVKEGQAGIDVDFSHSRGCLLKGRIDGYHRKEGPISKFVWTGSVSANGPVRLWTTWKYRNISWEKPISPRTIQSRQRKIFQYFTDGEISMDQYDCDILQLVREMQAYKIEKKFMAEHCVDYGNVVFNSNIDSLLRL